MSAEGFEWTPCAESGTSSFRRRNGALWCEGVAVADLAERFSTPLYVYSMATIDDRVDRLRSAFGDEATICFAVKANPNLSLLRHLHGRGIGFDLVSGGELRRLEAAGVPTRGAVFAGVAKQPWEIEEAVSRGIALFNVESEYELSLLSAAGAAAGRVVDVALRINPDVEAATHAYITTGKGHNKFGVSLERAGTVVEAIAADPWLRLRGYHTHIGSQLRSVEPYVAAFEKVAAFVDSDPVRGEGVTHYDLGGGFGIAYGEGEPLDVEALAGALLPRLRARGWRPVLEPGRFLVGDAGILVTRVIGEKTQGGRRFVLVDAAMNDLMRPALYQAEHPIAPVESREEVTEHVDVVGPVCETGDFLGRDRALPALEAGDLLAVFGAGAYGASMASNYNSRCRPAEVSVAGSEARLVRRRETPTELFAAEIDLDEA